MSNLSAALDEQSYDDTDERPGQAPTPVEVRRNGARSRRRWAAWPRRSPSPTSPAPPAAARWLDWALVLVMGAIARGLPASRSSTPATPLLVADEQGVRIRLGRSWRGLPWSASSTSSTSRAAGCSATAAWWCVAHDRRAPRRPGRSALPSGPVDGPTHGSPLAMPLALSTRVTGADGDLTAGARAARRRADQVVERRVVGRDPRRRRPTDRRARRSTSLRSTPTSTTTSAVHDVRAPTMARDADAERRPRPGAEPPSPRSPWRCRSSPARPRSRCATRSAAPAPRSGSTAPPRSRPTPSETDGTTSRDLPEARELRRPGSVDLVEDTVVWSDRVQPDLPSRATRSPRSSSTTSTVEPAADPVVGPELAAARTRLGADASTSSPSAPGSVRT